MIATKADPFNKIYPNAEEAIKGVKIITLIY